MYSSYHYCFCPIILLTSSEKKPGWQPTMWNYYIRFAFLFSYLLKFNLWCSQRHNVAFRSQNCCTQTPIMWPAPYVWWAFNVCLQDKKKSYFLPLWKVFGWVEAPNISILRKFRQRLETIFFFCQKRKLICIKNRFGNRQSLKKKI